jgi:hypothetical protein
MELPRCVYDYCLAYAENGMHPILKAVCRDSVAIERIGDMMIFVSRYATHGSGVEPHKNENKAPAESDYRGPILETNTTEFEFSVWSWFY